MGSPDLHVAARQRRGPIADRSQRTNGECPHHAGSGRRAAGAAARRTARRTAPVATRRRPRGGGQGNAQQDFNEQRLIIKGLLDPAGTKRLRRRDPRGPRRRRGPDGGRHPGHRKRHLRHAAHAHRSVPGIHRGQGRSRPEGRGATYRRTMRRCSSGHARSSPRCSTA